MTISADVLNSARFNVREFARTARGNHRAELDLSSFTDAPLQPDVLTLVRYLGRLESATMEHLRNLLVTATHKDARVTAFLVTWAFEKFWIADALDAVLEANGSSRAQDLPEGKPRRTLKEANERRGPIRRAVAAIGLGVPIIAVHTTTGLIDEWIMTTAYEHLAQASKSPSLSSTISTILEVKKRHAAFFADETRRRLAESSRAVRQTRSALINAVFPIGAVDRAADERDAFEQFVFGAKDGLQRVRAIEERVRELPGIDARIAAIVASRLTFQGLAQ
jgi:hypothetical protein